MARDPHITSVTAQHARATQSESRRKTSATPTRTPQDRRSVEHCLARHTDLQRVVGGSGESLPPHRATPATRSAPHRQSPWSEGQTDRESLFVGKVAYARGRQLVEASASVRVRPPLEDPVVLEQRQTWRAGSSIFPAGPRGSHRTSGSRAACCARSGASSASRTPPHRARSGRTGRRCPVAAVLRRTRRRQVHLPVFVVRILYLNGCRRRATLKEWRPSSRR